MKGINTLAFHLLGSELVTGQSALSYGFTTANWVQADHVGPSYTINALVNKTDGTTEILYPNPYWHNGRWCGGRNFVQGLSFANPYGSETAWFVNVGMFCAYDDGQPAHTVRYSDKLSSFTSFSGNISCVTRPDGDEDTGISSIAFAAVNGFFGKGSLTCGDEVMSYVTNHTDYNSSAEILSSMDCSENQVVIGTNFAYNKTAGFTGLIAVRMWCGSKIYRNIMPSLSSTYDGLLSVGEYQPSTTLPKNLTTELPLICPDNMFLSHLDYIRSESYNSSLWTVRLSCRNGTTDTVNHLVESSVPVSQLGEGSSGDLGTSAVVLSPVCSYKGMSIPMEGLRQPTVDLPGTDSWTGKYGMPGIQGVCVDRQSHIWVNESSGIEVDTWTLTVCPITHIAVGVIPLYDSTYSGQGLNYLQLLCREQSSTCTPITAN